MKITWSIPVFGQALGSGRGDLVRARALIEALRSRGHDVWVVEARDRPGRRMDDVLRQGLADRILPERGRLPLRDLARWWRGRGHGRRVTRAATEQGAEILVETQVHGVTSGSLAARSTGLPLVLDDVSPMAEASRLGVGFPSLGRWAFERQRSGAAHLVMSSRRIREILAGDAASGPGTVIPNGVDLSGHRQASRRAGRRALGAGDDVLIVFAGSFQPWHAVHHLVRAVATMQTETPVRLVLLGDGVERDRALDEARDLGVRGRVVAPGSVSPERVPDLLAGCDLGALPGTNDYGHPMKLLEYAAAGLPLVAPDVPTVREMMGHGLPAVLFPPGDVGSLTRSLERLVETPELRDGLGRAARHWASRDSDWRARGAALEGLLERIVAGRAPRPVTRSPEP